MIYFLFVVVVTLLTFLIFSIKKNLELNEQLEDVTGQIEESLDILDEYYARIDKKTKIEMFSDEPIIKELVADIGASRDAILLIANKISNNNDEKTLTNDRT